MKRCGGSLLYATVTGYLARLVMPVVLALCLLAPAMVKAQQPYLVFFKDKAGSSFTTDRAEAFLSARAIARRQRQGIVVSARDLPVSPHYLEQIAATGARVQYTTRWLNGALVYATPEQLPQLLALPFLRQANFPAGTLSPKAYYHKYMAPAFQPAGTATDPGRAAGQLSMLGITDMFEKGYRGQGIIIAVFDSGFFRADQLPGFDSLFSQNRVLATYDFVSNETAVFDNHRHGMQVLSVLAANQPGELLGSAPGASYMLFRTEDVRNESRLEEFYWLLAAEYADSAGVDIINSSLGYNLFDAPADDYRPEDLNGGTALVTIAAELAAATGMLVVNSAGNEGNGLWLGVVPPADGDSVLAVGAVDREGLLARFSSLGPTADGRIKPDLAAQGAGTVLLSPDGRITTSSGTSFSAPLVTGLAAGIWQAFPQLSAMQLLQILKEGSTQAASPDNFMGYGLPDFNLIYSMVTGEEAAPTDTKIVAWPNPVQGQALQLCFPARMSGTAVQLQLFQTDGKLAWQKQVNAAPQVTALQIADFPRSGMYLLRLQWPNGQKVMRLLFR